MQNRAIFYVCCILRATRAGRCRERRYANHIFIQTYFRMHHFVVKFSSPQAAREHWPPRQILQTLLDLVGVNNSESNSSNVCWPCWGLLFLPSQKISDENFFEEIQEFCCSSTDEFVQFWQITTDSYVWKSIWTQILAGILAQFIVFVIFTISLRETSLHCHCTQTLSYINNFPMYILQALLLSH